VSYTQVSVGDRSLCAVADGGNLACAGLQVPPPTGLFTAVSVGGNYACGIRTDGYLSCWGAEEVTTHSPSGVFRSVAAGRYHACAIRADGTPVCWGRNDAGQGTPPARRFTEVVVGDDFSCGITDGSTLRCWGRPAWIDRTPSGAFKGLAAGADHICALTTGGSVQCFGDNGTGETDPPSLVNVVQIAAGPGTSCALRGDLTTVCWGSNRDLVLRTPLTRFDDIAAGHGFACGLRDGGAIECWGRNSAYGFPDLAGRSACGLTYGPAPACLGGASCESDPDLGLALQCDDGDNAVEAAREMPGVSDGDDGWNQVSARIADGDEDWVRFRVSDQSLSFFQPRIEVDSTANVALCAYFRPDDTELVHAPACAESADGTTFPSTAFVDGATVSGCCVEGRAGVTRSAPLLVIGSSTADWSGTAWVRVVGRQLSGDYLLRWTF